MKKMISMFAFCAVMALGFSAVRAAAEETTVKGTLKCAKCSMKEAEKCEAVLVTADGTKYYLGKNDAGKAAHKEICKADKEGVSVTGTVTEKDGKKMIAATKVE
jgi:hypothetical protein